MTSGENSVLPESESGDAAKLRSQKLFPIEPFDR